MIDVGGNNHAAASDFVTHQFGRKLLAMGDISHLFRDHALPRVVHLREVAVRVLLLAPGEPLRAGLGDAVGVTAVAGTSIAGGHFGTSFRVDSTGSDYTRTRRTNGTSSKPADAQTS